MPRVLTSAEAARRLGVKVSTLYAYVSRGVLESHRAPDGRTSLYSLEDIERLAGRGRLGRSPGPRVAMVTTSVTQLGPLGPRYRGIDAASLADHSTYEQVAELLWGVEPDPLAGPARWGAEPEAGVVARPGASPGDLIRLAVLEDSIGRHGRFDWRPDAVVVAARRVIGAAARALPVIARERPPLRLGSKPEVSSSIAEALSVRLCTDPREQFVRTINAAMVLLADHEMSTAALAARVAASSRADLCNVLLAGLGALGGPLHGSASAPAHELLARAHEQGAGCSIEHALRWHQHVPGFGHAVYPAGDPRTAVLLEDVEQVAPPDRWHTVTEVLSEAERLRIPAPNIDMALAALSFCIGLMVEAGEVIFSVARLAGLVAHALEEVAERPLRFRARAVYSRS